MVKFEFVEENEASELLTHEQENTPTKILEETSIKDIKEQKIPPKTDRKSIINDDIETILSEIQINKSAMLNLNKFLYSVFTGKTTTNLRKRIIKQTNLDYLRKW